jgi:hypothetical protein
MEYRGGGPLHVPRFELPDARVGGQKFHLLEGDLIPSGEPRRLGRFPRMKRALRFSRVERQTSCNNRNEM